MAPNTDPMVESPSQGTDNSPPADNAPSTATRGNNEVPKPKRLACMICRKRKLRCDGLKPSCSTCTRLGHSCAYDEVRKKSGPKRGYVKALEERLSTQPCLFLDREAAWHPLSFGSLHRDSIMEILARIANQRHCLAGRASRGAVKDPGTRQ